MDDSLYVKKLQRPSIILVSWTIHISQFPDFFILHYSHCNGNLPTVCWAKKQCKSMKQLTCHGFGEGENKSGVAFVEQVKGNSENRPQDDSILMDDLESVLEGSSKHLINKKIKLSITLTCLENSKNANLYSIGKKNHLQLNNTFAMRFS